MKSKEDRELEALARCPKSALVEGTHRWVDLTASGWATGCGPRGAADL